MQIILNCEDYFIWNHSSFIFLLYMSYCYTPFSCFVVAKTIVYFVFLLNILDFQSNVKCVCFFFLFLFVFSCILYVPKCIATGSTKTNPWTCSELQTDLFKESMFLLFISFDGFFVHFAPARTEVVKAILHM